MPKEAERRLRAQAKKKFPKDRVKQEAYIYGALRKMGWKPEGEK